MVSGGVRRYAHYDPQVQAAKKKDDDDRRSSAALSSASWTPSKLRLRGRRRIWVLLSITVLLWLLYRSLPEAFWEPSLVGRQRLAQFHLGTGHGGLGLRPDHDAPGDASHGFKGKAGSSDPDESRPPPRPKSQKPREHIYYYDGEILFRRLPSTLNKIQRTLGWRELNPNVLFAASSLKSLSTILPLACAMSKRDTNFVHFAVFGRSALGLEEIWHVNALDKEDCGIIWHDARPNWAEYSSDYRAEASVASALEYIQPMMHPQVLIMDDSSLEDLWFTRQVRVKANKFGMPVIELPTGASEKLHWLSRLDAQALRTFHKTTVEILVQAPQGEAGGLIRLSQSLAQADYSGLPIPKVTIELPSEIDPMLQWHIEKFKWPPSVSPSQLTLASQLNIRHRIPGQPLTAEEASLRFFESFYPVESEHSHVLVLNNNIELSPLFFHWLMYYILHYRHSRHRSSALESLLGISLNLPATYLNGTKDFESSALDAAELPWTGKAHPREGDVRPPFLWQAPNPNAGLVFGDKWIELHSFLKHRIRVDKERQGKRNGIVGDLLPAWSEYVIELMRARGWSMLYPAGGEAVDPMAVVHSDLWKPPEEFRADYEASLRNKIQDGGDDGGVPTSDGSSEPLRAIEAHWKMPDVQLPTIHQPLHIVLPYQGDEPSLRALPSLLYDGTPAEQEDVDQAASDYSEEFRSKIGRCNKYSGTRKIVPGKADDLFCWRNEKEDRWVEPARDYPGKGAAKGM